MNFIFRILLIYTIFTFSKSDYLYCQPIQEWASQFVSNSIWTTGLSIDSSGNVILAGNINRQQSFLVKYDKSGNQIWVKLIPDIPVVYSFNSNIVVDNNNNICISGQNYGKVVTKKFSENGVNIWTDNFILDTYSMDANSIGLDNNSNIYICQVYGGFNESGMTLVKYDSTGNIIWKKRIKGYFWNNILNLDNQNNIVVTCGINNDFVTLKFNQLGDSIWSNSYRTSLLDAPIASAIDDSNNIFVTGECERFQNGLHGKLITIKYNSNGIEKWVRVYQLNNISMDRGESITIDKWGSIIVTGRSRSLSGDLDFVTIKYSQQGDSLWVRRFNGAANLDDVPSKVIIDSAGNIYVTGYSTKSNIVKEIVTLKYSTSGQLMWIVKYNYPVNLIGHYLVRDNNSNVYIAGSNLVNSNGNLAVCIKYSQPIGINSNSNEIPICYKLYNAYPNPFNPATKIKFDISGTLVAQTFLSVYDILGREVDVLVNTDLQPGTYEVDWDGSSYASGVYYYRLSVLNSGSLVRYQETKRMLLIK